MFNFLLVSKIILKQFYKDKLNFPVTFDNNEICIPK